MQKLRLYIKQIFLTLLYLTGIKELRKSDIPFGISKGKKVMIFGNGPSLKLLIEKYHKNEITVTQDSCFVNYSPLDDFFFEVKPNNLFLSDLTFSRDGEWTPRVKKMYERLQNMVDWDLTIFVTRNNRKECKELVDYAKITNPNVHYRFIYKRNCDDFIPSLRNRLYKTGYFLPIEHTVIGTAIWLSILEQYSEIDLYGVETDQFKDFIVEDDNSLYMIDRHFYGERKRRVYTDVNANVKIYEMLRTYTGMLRLHYILSQFADYMGVKIYNCTPHSMIDSYERKKTLD